jgi:ligand-binding SRPBCC domain-containing protein
MMRFRHRQKVAASVERTSAFFHDARNLTKLTPPYPAMRVNGGATAVVPGALFALRMDFGVFAFTWHSAIESVESDGSFTDTFQGVMFRQWRHTHRFTGEGAGCVVIDEVECEPVWWFRPFAGLFLKALFGFRRRVLPTALA